MLRRPAGTRTSGRWCLAWWRPRGGACQTRGTRSGRRRPPSAVWALIEMNTHLKKKQIVSFKMYSLFLSNWNERLNKKTEFVWACLRLNSFLPGLGTGEFLPQISGIWLNLKVFGDRIFPFLLLFGDEKNWRLIYCLGKFGKILFIVWGFFRKSLGNWLNWDLPTLCALELCGNSDSTR